MNNHNLLNTNYNLSGKTALVTGAAGLLGVEHTIALLKIGAKVIMTDINYKKLVENSNFIKKTIGIKPIIYKMDVTDKKSIKKINSILLKKGLHVSILINNAALNPSMKNKNKIENNRLENFKVETFRRDFEIGLIGALLCSIEFGLSMSKKKGGVIINISSDLSVISPDQRLYKKSIVSDSNQPVKPVSYSIIKTGLVGLTRYLSTYWSHKNVRSNALSPGGIYDNQNDKFVKKLNNLIPLGRMAKKDEYHGVIQFLSSDASKYLNGQNIVMDGGRSVW
tara:strand:- start:117 stop:956 length:840 start_codon:yes stop_codon:yes gene_type:complete